MIGVGEYGRTNLGKIIKFAWLQDENGIREKNKVILVDLMLTETRPYYYFKKDEFIVKHSKNIIDLIEEGDYVISQDGIEGKVEFVMLPLKIFVDGEEVLNDDIKSIVTKEKFEAMEYKVKE